MKKIVILLLCLAAVSAAGFFGLKQYQKSRDEKRVVDVVPVGAMAIPNYGYYGDENSMYGYTNAANAQRVMLDTEKLVKNVFDEDGLDHEAVHARRPRFLFNVGIFVGSQNNHGRSHADNATNLADSFNAVLFGNGQNGLPLFGGARLAVNDKIHFFRHDRHLRSFRPLSRDKP